MTSHFWRTIKNGRRLLSRQQTNIFSAAATIALAMLASALLGILRDRLLYARFFASSPQELDAYNAAFKIPDLLFQLLITGSISAAFIPLFSQALEKKNSQKAQKIASSLFSFLLLSFLVLAVVLFIFAKPLSGLITSGFSPDQINLMAKLTRLLLAAQFFLVISNFLTAVLHAHQYFLPSALSPIFYNLGIILGVIFLSPVLGIYGPTIGVILGTILHFAIQLPLFKRLNFPLTFSFGDLLSPENKKTIFLMIPRSLALVISEFEAIITIYLATTLGEGVLSLFYLAQHLAQLPVRLLGASVGQAALPILSRQASNQQSGASFGPLSASLLTQIVFFALPVGALFLILRVPLVRLAFGAQEFPWEATLLTGKVLAVLTISIFTQTLNEILRRYFYVFKDTAGVLKIDGLATLFYFLFTVLVTNQTSWGILGLAAGLSLANLFRSLAFIFVLNKKIGPLFPKEKIISFLKIFLATVLLAFSTWIAMHFLDAYVFDTSRVIPLAILTTIAALAGIITYFLTAKVLELEEFSSFRKMLQKRLKP
ncbi:hypothetical protein KBI33_03570 [Candidatus Shapirobacteria bacterium]|nr:hypothetical protein [Candidatus Shapirobacteria bacterium]